VSSIQLVRNHCLDLEQARAAARRVADDLEQGYGMACEWDGDVLRFSRTGVEGEMAVLPDRIEMQLQLGVLLGAFAPRIEAQLQRNFDAYFGPPAEA
jgi:putative polyhydroxyalkanoate system protein